MRRLGEGAANMMWMDLRRAMLKDPRTIEALLDEVRPLKGQDSRFDAMVVLPYNLSAVADSQKLAR